MTPNVPGNDSPWIQIQRNRAAHPAFASFQPVYISSPNLIGSNLVEVLAQQVVSHGISGFALGGNFLGNSLTGQVRQVSNKQRRGWGK
ncbi:conserved hypothetical protein [Teredinibacter turnerae T7901]|uniref:Uncharacterized protein n=1 Tax=Teredinibacter turnerae (strain ATCC 39867 / T7901) TaxID=377629 RepID=C6AR28_TERTT|nr:conserved hypothetical protein [Teredinibacter turnerae T7901]